jgi:hypothetical protein
MCLIIINGGLCRRTCIAPGIDPDLYLDRTDPCLSQEPEEQKSYQLPALGACLSAARAEALCSALCEAFAMIGKIEAAFSYYWNGKVGDSEKVYDKAINHAQELLEWLDKLEDRANEHLSWQKKQKSDPKDEEIVRQVDYRDVAPLLLNTGEISQPTPIWKELAQCVKEQGTDGILKAGFEQFADLRDAAKDILASLKFARPAIRQGKFFETISYRSQPTYLDAAMLRLVSGMLRLLLVMNSCAALERVAGKKKLRSGD